VILTGAGISAESGLQTFRDSGGIWSQVRIEDVATPEAWARDRARVTTFYNARRQQLVDPAIAPNAAHRALAELQRRWPGELLLVTQNVDDLHERAGAEAFHMHGRLDHVRCVACGVDSPWRALVTPESECPACGATAGLRPSVVWFGEIPHGLERIDQALSDCDLFIAIGTSGTVYPAAGFSAVARNHGAYTIEVNLEATGRFDRRLLGPATETVPALVAELLA
jgi:NAD-dependent deacetylase